MWMRVQGSSTLLTVTPPTLSTCPCARLLMVQIWTCSSNVTGECPHFPSGAAPAASAEPRSLLEMGTRDQGTESYHSLSSRRAKHWVGAVCAPSVWRGACQRDYGLGHLRHGGATAGMNESRGSFVTLVRAEDTPRMEASRNDPQAEGEILTTTP